MIAYLPPLLFFSLGWFLHDPVTLLASFVLSIASLGVLFIQKDYRWLLGSEQKLLLIIVVLLSFSALLNGENWVLALQGNYQRNFGILFWISIWIVFSYSTSGKVRTVDFLQRSLIVLGFASILYGVIQYLDRDPIPWSNPFRSVQLTLGNPNFAGALVGMISVLFFAQFFVSGGTFYKRFISFLGFCSLLIVARGTNSIQAYVVTIIGVVVFLSIYSFRSSLRYLRGIKYFSFTALFSIIGFFLVILTPSFGFLADVRAKFFYQGSVTQRLEFWRAGLSIFRDNPWFGVGPDQFQRYAALYRTPEQVTRDGVFSIPDKAHSVPIDLLANGGILAGIAWLIFVTLIFLRLIQLMRMDISNDLRRDLSILGGIWSGYIFQALISPDQLVLSVIGFISAGLIINIFRKQKVPKNSSKSRILKTLDINILRVFVATILLFASILWIQSMRTDIRAKEILGKENLNKEEILKAVDEWPAPKTTELIAVAVSGADPGCEILNDISNRMIELDERSAQGWYLQAICRNVKQDFTGALSASDKALEFDPINPVYLVAKAKLGLASQNKLATEAALQVLKNNYPDNPEIKQIEGYLTLISN